ncbi:MAG TPA: ATPase, T2SS/T4P/T4SS family [Syntrophales bacterium]|nr:ATPase, T2SS/T4P/T4SS family [Syntrophales bacterium]HOL58506.1 ATPase, T2SS/T4P/T4SS family [Syntrophales bacterium]HPO34886.1 ATPase, T2SS/T4P/T4SS family [Syntrophales bacterium]
MSASVALPSIKNLHVEIEFVNGQILEAVLTEDLSAHAEWVTILVEPVHILQKYALNDICTIRILERLNLAQLNGAPEIEVATVTGNIYRVRTCEGMDYERGFWGIPLNGSSPYSLIFFTWVGVKTSCELEKLGQMLFKQGVVEREELEKALAEQEKLRERKLGEIISSQTAISHRAIEEKIEKAKREGRHPRIRVGDILIEAGLITKDQLERALAEQEKGKKKKLGELLIEKGLITEDQLVHVLAHKFRMPMVDLDKEIPNPKALETVPFEIAQRLKVFPLLDDGVKLVAATCDPTDYSIYDYLRFYTRRRIELVAATRRQIEEAIVRHYPKASFLTDHVIEDLTVLEAKEEAEEEDATLSLSESDSQIVNIVNKLLIDAFTKDASDIHLEPGMGDTPLTIRYRIDGICRIAHQIPNSYRRAIISRLKIMANLDIAERRKPQSGKILIKYQNRKIEYRLEVTPTVGGNEDAVLRILTSAKPLPLEKMGFSPKNLQWFKTILEYPYGIILCVGPTGSGKTTTLHSALSHINKEERKIWTAEDPVEIVQPGLRQVQVLPKIGLTFAEVLRSFLRADPDVIMIGEMRDFETAKTAVEASLTGHLVLSTLHTNSAVETIQRLIEMGIEPVNFADALLGILAQRLARRLCEKCKEPYHPTREEFDRLVFHYNAYWWERHEMPTYDDHTLLWRKVGCNNCGGTGYRGRLAVHELVVGTEKIKKEIKARATADTIRNTALEEGMRTLLMDGISKVLQGETDLEQILKVCITSTVSDYR